MEISHTKHIVMALSIVVLSGLSLSSQADGGHRHYARCGHSYYNGYGHNYYGHNYYGHGYYGNSYYGYNNYPRYSSYDDDDYQPRRQHRINVIPHINARIHLPGLSLSLH